MKPIEGKVIEKHIWDHIEKTCSNWKRYFDMNKKIIDKKINKNHKGINNENHRETHQPRSD